MLVLSTTPRQESLLNALERMNFLGVGSSLIPYDDTRDICVGFLLSSTSKPVRLTREWKIQEVFIYETSPAARESMMKKLRRMYMTCDVMALMYSQNDFKSFDALVGVQRELQNSFPASCSVHPQLALISSTLEGLPMANTNVSGLLPEKGESHRNVTFSLRGKLLPSLPPTVSQLPLVSPLQETTRVILLPCLTLPSPR